MELENLKIGKYVKITFEEAKNLLKGSPGEYDFIRLNEDKKTVVNRKYYLIKTGKSGYIVNKGYPNKFAVKTGVFEVQMDWDYRHPINFSENQNGLSRSFEFYV